MIKKQCKQCGKLFTISDSEINFYKNKNLSIPKRCKECRNTNKKCNSNRKLTDINERLENIISNFDAQSSSHTEVTSDYHKKTGLPKIIACSAAALLIITVVAGVSLFSSFGSDETADADIPVSSSRTDCTYPQSSDSQSQTDYIFSQSSDTDKTPVTITSQPKQIDFTDVPGGNDYDDSDALVFRFKNQNLLESHFEKHGKEMNFESAQEYELAACNVINSSDALHKTEAEDGDDIYYIESTNDFVIVSTEGYIRTYFRPDSGKKYYDKQ